MASLPSTESVEPASVRKQLLGPHRRRFLGRNADGWLHWFFQGNAAISIVVLLLIVFTLFHEAADFIPRNRRNLEIYRKAGLEFVDILKRQTEAFSALNRQFSAVRLAWLERLRAEGVSLTDANHRLAPLDALGDRMSDAIAGHNDILAAMTEQASAVKDRAKVNQDMVEARQHFSAAAAAEPERAAKLRGQAAAITEERIDFAAEVAALTGRLPEIKTANQRLAGELTAVGGAFPRTGDAAIAKRLNQLHEAIQEFVESLPERELTMEHWRPDAAVSLWESFHAFAFGRDWITASFWQDWYGVLPLFLGSVFISALALLFAIPLGICAALYVNQVARPWEQHFIKPYIEFISAIPSVVLGFFGIAVLGETLRHVSQSAWLAWIPGFPMRERLTAFTAAALLALMAIPTIFTLAEDALNNVPRAFKEASLALGATRLQTMVHIILPAALSGIAAAVLLGFGRVIGETMVVLLCAGNRIEIPDFSAGLGVVFQPMHTMTGIIAQEMGEVVRGDLPYRALFMVGCLLFLLSLGINYGAQKIVRRYRLPQG